MLRFSQYMLCTLLLWLKTTAESIESSLTAVMNISDSYQGCEKSCHRLQQQFHLNVTFPGQPLYVDQQKYWSIFQAQTQPACRVNPRNVQDVSRIIKTLSQFSCKFAVKSGGHAACSGASNVQGGVTIDLVGLNTIRVSKDRNKAILGAGNTWGPVYRALEKHNLTVIGGRVSGIGVGGLTLGGGISFFSSRFGWALDNVLEYEIVLANGLTGKVNQKSNPDLYFALRGGGNNFGIVTTFTLATFPQGQMWGGSMLYAESQKVALANAFDAFTEESPKHPDAALISSFAYFQGSYFVSCETTNALPLADGGPAFEHFRKIPRLQDTTRITSLSNLTDELSILNPDGLRETYSTLTVKAHGYMYLDSINICRQEFLNVETAAGIIPACVLQPITDGMISNFAKRGGNALGIVKANGPLLLFSVAIMWTDTADDKRVLTTAQNIISRVARLSREKGADFPYIYQNYASEDQKVFRSYGQKNCKRLERIAARVDPAGVFRKLQPGYFKLKC